MNYQNLNESFIISFENSQITALSPGGHLLVFDKSVAENNIHVLREQARVYTTWKAWYRPFPLIIVATTY